MGDPQRDRLASTALKIRFKYASVDEFIRQCSNDISLLGIFIKTKYPRKEGGPFKLELQQIDGSPIVRGIGQVVWSREVARSNDGPSGMGIKFLKLDDASRHVVQRAVEARGSAPSRFDSLEESAARASGESEAPFPRRTNTLIGIQAESVFTSDRPSSLSPESEGLTSGSSPVDAGSPGYSLTRDAASVPNHVEEASASSSEQPGEQLLLAGSDPAPFAPPATTFTQVIPQGDEGGTRSVKSANDHMAARDNAGEPTPSSVRTSGAALRERLVKHAASIPPPIWSEHESTQRVERLAELSQAEIRAYAGPREKWAHEISEMEKRASEPMLHRFRRSSMFGQVGARAAAAMRFGIGFTRTTWIQRGRELASGALWVALVVGVIGACWVLAPAAWQAAWFGDDKTDQAPVTAGVERPRQNAEKLPSVEALQTRSEPEPAIERVGPKRYLLKVVTRPAGAMVAVGNKRFITPGEVELVKPKGALLVNVQKKLHQSIQRRITATEFHQDGDRLTHTLDLRLKKLSSNAPRKNPPAIVPESKPSGFHIESTPEVPKLSVESF